MNTGKCAETSVYLATSSDVDQVSGGYFEKKKKVAPGENATDDTNNRRLWDLSMRLAGLN